MHHMFIFSVVPSLLHKRRVTGTLPERHLERQTLSFRAYRCCHKQKAAAYRVHTHQYDPPHSARSIHICLCLRRGSFPFLPTPNDFFVQIQVVLIAQQQVSAYASLNPETKACHTLMVDALPSACNFSIRPVYICPPICSETPLPF